MSDTVFVAVTPDALALVEAVHAGDEDAAREVLTRQSEATLWAMATALAAMTPGRPNPERVLRFCCGTETRLTYSDRPQTWPVEDLQDALCVARARTAPGARWVARGVAEWKRRREVRERKQAELDAEAMRVRQGRHLGVAS